MRAVKFCARAQLIAADAKQHTGRKVLTEIVMKQGRHASHGNSQLEDRFLDHRAIALRMWTKLTTCAVARIRFINVYCAGLLITGYIILSSSSSSEDTSMFPNN